MTNATSITKTTFYGIPERFDLNRVDLQGRIYKIWSREDGNLYARIQVDPTSDAQKVRHSPRLTLALLDGMIGGREISMVNGDHICVAGYVRDLSYQETLLEFLARARKSDLLAEIPALKEAAGISARRIMTCVIPETQNVLAEDDSLELFEDWNNTNSVRIEGIVARTWSYADHSYARLAVYDRYTEASSEGQLSARPRRSPHYVTIQFTNGMVDGRSVGIQGKSSPGACVIAEKQRIRVTGRFIYRIYWQDLRGFLLDAKRADLLSVLPDSDRIAEIKASSIQTAIDAQKLIQYT